MIRSIVLGSGAYLPKRIVTNAELANRMDTSDDWIRQRTGISQRHIAADGEIDLGFGYSCSKVGARKCGNSNR